ncbi:hypothetical protein [Modicisalibacter xianhensis]|uniref:Uncharacterized protein n=1 Tax=Modicisalibacter xianhensis TaxID=442341 RepID=A0A1I3ER20_9GAMM|nr:hypothetical protein [Halomonas xianhensis]SFI01425.1 hypothetical protein SAMN04487959_114123 [Halomonas xianhensis]
MVDSKVAAETPPMFDEMLTMVAKEQLGLDGSYTVYAVATDQIDEINLAMIEGLEDIHLHSFTVRLPPGLVRVSLAPRDGDRWRMEDAVHGVVDYGHPARESMSANCSGSDRRLYIPTSNGKH